MLWSEMAEVHGNRTPAQDTGETAVPELGSAESGALRAGSLPESVHAAAFDGVVADDLNPEDPASRQTTEAEAWANAALGGSDHQKFDPRLDSLIDAWPRLPEAIRAGILAMIQAAERATD